MIYDFTKNFSLKLRPKISLKEDLVTQRATEATLRSTETENYLVFSLCNSVLSLCTSV
jgi:hypothetical protein